MLAVQAAPTGDGSLPRRQAMNTPSKELEEPLEARVPSEAALVKVANRLRWPPM